MGIFSKPLRPSEEQIRSNLDSLDKAYINAVKELVSMAMEMYPVKKKQTLKFEAAIFALFRLDYFMLQIGLKMPQIREWLNSAIDAHIMTIGSYAPQNVDTRMKVYAGNLQYLKNKNDFMKNFITVQYNTYFGLLRRASEIDEWWQSIDLKDDETIPIGGLEVYMMSIPIEESVFLPLFKYYKDLLSLLGAI